ncbi:hypothetical protein BdWA1_003334 [Babesia duncani]|uniref:Uncharacterized protein n=1 Tax=Babesia duncani TaxID=323732 RepID=A0AAD9PHJ5_9APIC|nr:hypothetical protein BdWA1_003961 [Babesia duncani]KAK2195654.1 hypothetical protein BdWA1_003334 [Babesia duncani]
MARTQNPILLAVLLLAIAAAIVGVVYIVPRGDNGSHPSEGGRNDDGLGNNNGLPVIDGAQSELRAEELEAEEVEVAEQLSYCGQVAKPDPYDPRDGGFRKSLDAVCSFLALAKPVDDTPSTPTEIVNTKFGTDAVTFSNLVKDQVPHFNKLREQYNKLISETPAELKVWDPENFDMYLAALPGHITTIMKAFDEFKGVGVWSKAAETVATVDAEIANTYKAMREKLIELFDMAVKHSLFFDPARTNNLRKSLVWLATFYEHSPDSSNFNQWATNFESWVVPHFSNTTLSGDDKTVLDSFKKVVNQTSLPAVTLGTTQAVVVDNNEPAQSPGASISQASQTDSTVNNTQARTEVTDQKTQEDTASLSSGAGDAATGEQTQVVTEETSQMDQKSSGNSDSVSQGSASSPTNGSSEKKSQVTEVVEGAETTSTRMSSDDAVGTQSSEVALNGKGSEKTQATLQSSEHNDSVTSTSDSIDSEKVATKTEKVSPSTPESPDSKNPEQANTGNVVSDSTVTSPNAEKSPESDNPSMKVTGPQAASLPVTSNIQDSGRERQADDGKSVTSRPDNQSQGSNERAQQSQVQSPPSAAVEDSTEVTQKKVRQFLRNTFEQIKDVLAEANEIFDTQNTVFNPHVARINTLAPKTLEMLIESLEAMKKIAPKSYAARHVVPAKTVTPAAGTGSESEAKQVASTSKKDELAEMNDEVETLQLIAHLNKTYRMNKPSSVYYKKAPAVKRFKQKAFVLLDNLNALKPVLVLYRKEHFY